MAGKLKVKLVRSSVGSHRKMREHLLGLGLRRLNQVKELDDTPTVRGLIFKVRHLVEVDPPVAAQD